MGAFAAEQAEDDTYIRQIECGDRMPSLTLFARLRNILKRTPNQLLGEKT